MAAHTVPCPICKKKVRLDDPNMPFCSDRCRLQDLANWADEKYVIPGGQPRREADGEIEETEDEPEGPNL